MLQPAGRPCQPTTTNQNKTKKQNNDDVRRSSMEFRKYSTIDSFPRSLKKEGEIPIFQSILFNFIVSYSFLEHNESLAGVSCIRIEMKRKR